MFSKPTKVFLNDNIQSYTHQRGVTRYFRNIADGIITHFGQDATIFSPEIRQPYATARYIPAPKRFTTGRRRIQDMMVSLFTYHQRNTLVYSPYYGNVITNAKEVFTVYDMIHERFPHYFPQERKDIRQFTTQRRRCLERASSLIAISRNTANDIITVYPQINKDNIHVIHLGVEEFFFNTHTIPERQMAQKPFFLYVGHRTIYKNFLRLLSAFGQSGLAKEFNLRVISPSKDDFDATEYEYIQKYHLLSSVELVKEASDEYLHQSYAQAVAFVYPSEYEGFGLSILEAMASGTLVATSNCSSMPEVGGDVAFYFDPYDIDSIADCLIHISHLSSQQHFERIEHGRQRARLFSWEKCQQETIALFKQQCNM